MHKPMLQVVYSRQAGTLRKNSDRHLCATEALCRLGVRHQSSLRGIDNCSKMCFFKNNYAVGLILERKEFFMTDISMILRDPSKIRMYSGCISTKGHTVGLQADGTVVAIGNNKSFMGERICHQCDTDHWLGIVAVSAGGYHTVGLRTDGTVVAIGDNEEGECDTGAWRNIVAVSAGDSYTVGLKADGTAVAIGWNKTGQCNIKAWHDIIAISAGSQHTVGLRADGTVIASGSNSSGECKISDWRDIVAVSAGCFSTVGLKADGTVVAVGYNKDGQCDIGTWKNIGQAPCYEQNIGPVFDSWLKLSEERRPRKNQGLCVYCGGQLSNGFFSKKCKVCGK